MSSISTTARSTRCGTTWKPAGSLWPMSLPPSFWLPPRRGRARTGFRRRSSRGLPAWLWVRPLARTGSGTPGSSMRSPGTRVSGSSSPMFSTGAAWTSDGSSSTIWTSWEERLAPLKSQAPAPFSTISAGSASAGLEPGERLRVVAISTFEAVAHGGAIGGEEKQRDRQAPERNPQWASESSPSGDEQPHSPDKVSERALVRLSHVPLEAPVRGSDDDAMPVDLGPTAGIVVRDAKRRIVAKLEARFEEARCQVSVGAEADLVSGEKQRTNDVGMQEDVVVGKVGRGFR